MTAVSKNNYIQFAAVKGIAILKKNIIIECIVYTQLFLCFIYIYINIYIYIYIFYTANSPEQVNIFILDIFFPSRDSLYYVSNVLIKMIKLLFLHYY